MNKILFFIVCIFLLGCDDGNLQIETIDFDDIDAASCDNIIDAGENKVLFKIKTSEALILEILAGELENLNSGETAKSSTITQATTTSSLTYRFFNETISDTYFCADVPPSGITVQDEVLAEKGTLNIISKAASISATVKTYEHDIKIIDLTMVNDQGQRITDETGIDYGTFNTGTLSSIAEGFDNFTNTSVVLCPTVTDNNAILYKIINDEIVSIKIPSEALAKVEGSKTYTLGTDASFINSILSILATETHACSGISEDIEVNNFTAVSGEIIVNASLVSGTKYIYTFTLNNFQLKDKEADIVGTAIPSYFFGNIEIE